MASVCVLPIKQISNSTPNSTINTHNPSTPTFQYRLFCLNSLIPTFQTWSSSSTLQSLLSKLDPQSLTLRALSYFSFLFLIEYLEICWTNLHLCMFIFNVKMFINMIQKIYELTSNTERFRRSKMSLYATPNHTKEHGFVSPISVKFFVREIDWAHSQSEKTRVIHVVMNCRSS